MPKIQDKRTNIVPHKQAQTTTYENTNTGYSNTNTPYVKATELNSDSTATEAQHFTSSYIP
jgi:hypothetical protein